MTLRFASALSAAVLVCASGAMLAGPALALPCATRAHAPSFEDYKALTAAVGGPGVPRPKSRATSIAIRWKA